MAVLKARLAGLGVTVLPCHLGDVEPTLVRVSAQVLGTRPMFLVVHPDLARVAGVPVVMDYDQRSPAARGRAPPVAGPGRASP